MDILARIQHWYAPQCKGNLERQWGVQIDTLDNPGWSVSIALNETACAGRSFEEINIRRSDKDWIRCWKDGLVFEGCGDEYKLSAILECFLNFSEGA